jgi:hypothetical protein
VPGTLSRSYRAFCRKSASDRLLLLEALVWLAAARLIVLGVPFRLLARHMSGPGRALPAPPDAARIRRIGWALNAVGDRVPWRGKCLERALAGKVMLRVRGHSTTLFLGVARPEPGQSLRAHAWLRCGALPVVGEETVADPFAVVARFPSVDSPSPGT